MRLARGWAGGRAARPAGRPRPHGPPGPGGQAAHPEGEEEGGGGPGSCRHLQFARRAGGDKITEKRARTSKYLS